MNKTFKVLSNTDQYFLQAFYFENLSKACFPGVRYKYEYKSTARLNKKRYIVFHHWNNVRGYAIGTVSKIRMSISPLSHQVSFKYLFYLFI